MNKLQLYQAAINAVAFVRQFMFSENCYFRALDDSLQPFVDAVLACIPELTKSSVPEIVKSTKSNAE